MFLPAGLDSLAVILVKDQWRASAISGRATRACVVEVGPPSESIVFVSGYVQPVSGVD